MPTMMLSGFLVQLCLVCFVHAVPIEPLKSGDQGKTWEYGAAGGILALLVLLLDVTVFIEVLKSNRTPAAKLIWSLIDFLIPVVGNLIYWLFSDRAGHNCGSGYEPVA